MLGWLYCRVKYTHSVRFHGINQSPDLIRDFSVLRMKICRCEQHFNAGNTQKNVKYEPFALTQF